MPTTIQTDDLRSLKPIATGCRDGENQETWLVWWLFPRLTDFQAEIMTYDLLGLSEHPGCPGGVYSRKPVIKHSNSYTLIRQRGGLDI